MTNTTPQDRQRFLDWITANVPAIEDYFGLGKLQQWVQDGLSRMYNMYYDMWANNPEDCKNQFIARLTGMNPKYASYMSKAKNSGDMVRAEIAVIQNELDQTSKQITMWQSIVNSNTTDRMKQFASSLLASYTAQEKQVADTLKLYQDDLAKGLLNGTYA